MNLDQVTLRNRFIVFAVNQKESMQASFLAYEKEQGRRHPEWEQRMKKMLDMFMQLQNQDGSFST